MWSVLCGRSLSRTWWGLYWILSSNRLSSISAMSWDNEESYAPYKPDQTAHFKTLTNCQWNVNITWKQVGGGEGEGVIRFTTWDCRLGCYGRLSINHKNTEYEDETVVRWADVMLATWGSASACLAWTVSIMMSRWPMLLPGDTRRQSLVVLPVRHHQITVTHVITWRHLTTVSRHDTCTMCKCGNLLLTCRRVWKPTYMRSTQERLSYSLSVHKTYEMESETSNTVLGKTRQAISTAAITASLPQLVATFARSMGNGHHS